MNVVIESHIPFCRGVLEAAGHSVTYLPPEQITRGSLARADALIIRTRTRADEALLGGTPVRHVATATIGTDHIDFDFCRRAGIRVSSAPGCNAPAVAQYVLAVTATLRPEQWQRLTLGIVGVGHVGSIVERWARALGMRVLLCDPPRAAAEGTEGFTSLERIAAEADVITFHTPLDSTTRHMAGARFLAACARKPLIINAARGPVVDTPALIEALHSGTVSQAAVDCWENEPALSTELMELCAVATPHVAGYSLQGKQRATAMALHAVCPEVEMPMPAVAEAPSMQQILQSYSPLADTAALKARPADFEQLRNQYVYRPEP